MFFLLTHEPIIWKRFLQAMTLPLPPLRPYYRYSLRSNDFEIEQMVTRAISLDDNWRNHHTVARRHKVIPTDKFIVEMKLLPGGKYLVVSETDEEGFRYSISVWLLDDAHGPRVLARTHMDVKVFNLQAKYTRYQGQNGIMVSFVRRKFSRKTFPWLNPSQFAPNAEIDSPVPFDYEIACFCIALDQLEAMSDADIVPGSQKYYDRLKLLDPPFRTLAFMGSSQRMEHVSLFELNEEPYIIFVQQPSRIVLKNLSTGVRSTLQCNPAHDHPDKDQCYQSFARPEGYLRHPHDSHGILRTPLVLVQLFDMPIAGEKFRNNPREEAAIDDKYLSDFVISDCNTPSLGPDHPKLRPTTALLLPSQSKWRNALQNVAGTHPGTPFAGRPPTTIYRYAIRLFQNQSLQLTGSNKAHVLPGTDRAIIYHVPEDDRSDTPPLVNLRKYVDPGYPHPDLPAPDPDEDVGVFVPHAAEFRIGSSLP
ncbi:Fbox floxuridine [Salix suchowensis]|nr:Fbox floxuridine [Salix suchowensis]